MLGESGGRGAILEQCLCKLMFRPNPKVILQFIGMSATLGNARELCQFLDDANLFQTNFRPVTLVERIKLDSVLYKVDEECNWVMEKDLAEAKTSKVLNFKMQFKLKNLFKFPKILNLVC